MSGIVDLMDPDEGNVDTKGRALSRLVDHVCWLLSRTLFLGVVVLVTVYLDIPLRSIVEGNVWQQMERERTKLWRDEVRLLDLMRRQLDEMGKSIVTLRSSESIHSGELVRTRTDFTNALNRFEELFGARKSVLKDSELERVYYDIRNISRRIEGALDSGDDLADRRKFSAQADLFENLASKAKFLSDRYLCKSAPNEAGKKELCP